MSGTFQTDTGGTLIPLLSNEWTERVFGLSSSGKEASWANALIAIVYDVHLLGDYLPDNRDFEGITPPSVVAGDIIISLRKLDVKQSKDLEKYINQIVESEEDEHKSAALIIKTLQEKLPVFILMAENGALKKCFEQKGYTFKSVVNYHPTDDSVIYD